MFHLIATYYVFSQQHEDNRGRELGRDFDKPGKPRKKSPKRRRRSSSKSPKRRI
jgi:hypothetical protein